MEMSILVSSSRHTWILGTVWSVTAGLCPFWPVGNSRPEIPTLKSRYCAMIYSSTLTAALLRPWGACGLPSLFLAVTLRIFRKIANVFKLVNQRRRLKYFAWIITVIKYPTIAKLIIGVVYVWLKISTLKVLSIPVPTWSSWSWW